jgi:GcrA cell cycle regulator
VEEEMANQWADRWSTEAIETLKQRWDAGDTLDVIGANMGISRNAVAGKVHRLKLCPRQQGKNPLGKKQGPPRVKTASGRVFRMAPESMLPPAVRRPASKLVEPTALRLSIEQINGRTCKYPIGDPKHEDFHFCGVEKPFGEAPYCAFHDDIAHLANSAMRGTRVRNDVALSRNIGYSS